MPNKPVMHGHDHRPGGLDPSPTGPWHYVLASGATAWNSSTHYDAGDNVSHDVFQYTCVKDNTNIEPNVNSHWAWYWVIDVPLFQNSWDNVGGTYVQMRYKISVGPPHLLDRNNGSVVSYLNHTVHLQGSVSGGAALSTIFTLPPAYAPDADQHLAANDDSGAAVCITVKSSGDVINGFV